MITPLPAAPQRTDPPATFITKSDALLAALAQFVVDCNNTATALSQAATNDTSVTSNTIASSGDLTFTVSSGKSFQPGMALAVVDTAAPSTNYMFGIVKSYSGTTLVFTAKSSGGSGTKTAWTISQSISWLQFVPGLLSLAVGTAIASASTLNLSTATGNTVHVTGTTPISAVTMNAGQWMELIFDAACPLTYNATTNKLNTGGQSYTCSAGDSVFYFYDGTTVYGFISKIDGTPISAPSRIQSVTSSVAANALTLNYNGGVLDFRSATLTTGAPIANVTIAANSITIPSTATLGTISGQQARLVLLEAYNGGSPVACIVNLAGGVQLDETNLISPTTISAAATANNVIYSASAVGANSPYRVVGFFDITEATAGTWATDATLKQGIGGQALAALSSLGYGQTWQSVTRNIGTTYYNTTGKPIMFASGAVGASSSSLSISVSINGGTAFSFVSCGLPSGTAQGAGVVIIPAGASYVFSAINFSSWAPQELR